MSADALVLEQPTPSARRRRRRNRARYRRNWNQRPLKRDAHLPRCVVLTCRRKVRHETYEEAELVRRKHALGDTMCSYRCQRCNGGWHVGTVTGNHGRRP